MLRDGVIYNLSFRLRDINLDNINDIYLAINIIVIITTTFLEILIVVAFILELIIVIVFDIDNIVIVIIIAFKRPIFKLIAFDIDIKRRFIMSASFNKF